MHLTVEQRQAIRGAAKALGLPLQYQPRAEDAGNILRNVLAYALGMAATSRTPRERDRWNVEVIRAQMALEGKGRMN